MVRKYYGSMREQNPIKVTYNNIEITYEEYENKWEFELRGQERRCDSLKAAKELIDAPPPKSKKKFEPISAFRKAHHIFGDDLLTNFMHGRVTSVAEKVQCRRTEVWFVSDKGQREKIYAEEIFADDDRNKQLRATYDEREKEKTKLIKEQERTLKLMNRIELPEAE